VLDRRYPLDQIAEAYRYVETHQKIGNVVILIDDTAQDEAAQEDGVGL
jgi:Zinc-binding dehydrogenase